MLRFERHHPGAAAWLLLFAMALQSARLAYADDAAPIAPQLTSRGRLLASGAIGGSWTGEGFQSANQRWRLHASPALTYFLRDRLGLGLVFGGSMSKSQVGNPPVLIARQSDLFIGLLAAFDVRLTDRLSLLVQPGFHYVNQWNDVWQSETSPRPPAFPRSLRLQIVRPALGLQLLVRASPHLGFVVGPDFWADIIVDDGGLRRIQSALTPTSQRYMRAQLGLSAGLLLSF